MPILGILVTGDNHFIVRGRRPDPAEALALVRHWCWIQIGQTTPGALHGWSISSREFREDLQWAVVAPGEGQMTPAVSELLRELAARGIAIENLSSWEPSATENRDLP